MITGYISIQDFINSNFYCLFTSCCTLTGGASTGAIQDLINNATALIDNYLGYSLWNQPRKDVFKGTNNESYFTKINKIKTINSLTYREKQYFFPMGGVSTLSSNVVSGTINAIYIMDEDTGWLQVSNGFDKRFIYELNYEAGYNEIPYDIQTATKMLVAQLTQQMDTGNIANPDLSYDNIKLDSVAYELGNSRMIKNVILKDIRELNNLPVTIFKILDKYKISRLAV